MKKLLTLFLTIVMVVCLVNLNNSHTKAAAEMIVLGKNNAGVYGAYTDGTCTTVYSGPHASNIIVDDTTKPIFKLNGLDTSTNEAKIDIVVDSTIIIDGENKIKNNSDEYNLLNISSDVQATFISNNGANDCLVIEGNGDIGLLNISGQLILKTGEYKIKTTAHSGECFVIGSSGSLIVENAILKCEHAGGGVQNYSPINNVNGLQFTGNGYVVATNNNNADFSSIIYYQINVENALDGIDIVTSTETDGSNPKGGFLKYENRYGTKATYIRVGSDTGNFAKYVKLSKKQAPTPTPDPSPKDESCEKVIGPTWHWNNDKGVCEDYGVVGTSTR